MQEWTELNCRVKGRALTEDGGPLHRWKNEVRNCAQEAWRGGKIRGPSGLELSFDFPSTDFHRKVLRNLLKPTIDGIAAVVFDREPSSYEWAFEDWRIVQLTVAKRVSSTPGVGIRLYPVESKRPQRDPGAVFVPGVPRPGETAGEKEWAATIERGVGAAEWPAIEPPVVLGLQFVSPLRDSKTDIDNLVRPAAAAVERSIGVPGTAVVRIEASKEFECATQASGLYAVARTHRD